MQKEKFNEIWENIISVLIDKINDQNILKTKNNAKNRIYKIYQKEKNKVKKVNMSDPTKPIDRHKIAAIMMFSIIQEYPFYIPFSYKLKLLKNNSVIQKKYYYANEYLALYTALSILKNFEIYDQHHINQHRDTNDIIQPKTFNIGQDYYFNICLDLRFSKLSKKMNVLTFSNVFFLLEHFKESNNF